MFSFSSSIISGSFLIILIIYSFLLLSSAVTTNLNSFKPTFNSYFPNPSIEACVSSLVAFIVIVSTSFKTSILYSKMFLSKFIFPTFSSILLNLLE